MYRVVQKGRAGMPLALGWLIGSYLDAKLRAALPGWSIAMAESRILQPIKAVELEQIRARVGVPRDVPTLLCGFSAGCQSVRAALIANAVPNLLGVVVIDGTHASLPPLPWQIDVWRRVFERACAGEMIFAATCSDMHYTEKLAKGAYLSTENTLQEVLREELKIGEPLRIGRAYAERFASADTDGAAHRRQVNEIFPRVLAEIAGARVGSGVPHEGITAPPETLGERVAAWVRLEAAKGIREVPGPRSDARISAYLAPCVRDGKRVGLTSDETEWCAAARSAAVFASLEGEDPPHDYRISVRELCEDADNRDRLHLAGGGYKPKLGDAAIKGRSGETPLRGGKGHVETVVGVDPIMIVGGNENNAWGSPELAGDDVIAWIET